MESKQTLTDAFLLKRFEVTAHKAAECGLLVSNVLDQVKLAPLVILQGHVVLGVDGVHLTSSHRVTQKRAQEELCKAIKSFSEGLVRHLEVIVRVRQVGVGVAVAAVIADELSVLALIWVFFRAHEKHMFEEVSHAIEGLGVKGSADVHI